MNYKETKQITCVGVDLNILPIKELQELFERFNVVGGNRGEVYNSIYYIPKFNTELIEYLKENKLIIEDVQ